MNEDLHKAKGQKEKGAVLYFLAALGVQILGLCAYWYFIAP